MHKGTKKILGEVNSAFGLMLSRLMRTSDTALQIGCQTGDLQHIFTNPMHAYKTDVSAITENKENIEHSDLLDSIDEGSLNALPYSDNSYNFVFHLYHMHSLEPDTEEAIINEAFRVSNKYVAYTINCDANNPKTINYKSEQGWLDIITQIAIEHNFTKIWDNKFIISHELELLYENQ